MKIVVISGSPHKKGTSSALVNRFIEGATEVGHEVYRFDAAFKTVHPCQACRVCQSEVNQCIYHDDMEELNAKMLEADAIVFASPVYYFDLCSQIKTVIDRFYDKDEELITQKKTALLLSFADDTMTTVEGLLYNYKAMVGYFGWEIRGTVLGIGCNTADDILKTTFPDDAYELGKTI